MNIHEIGIDWTELVPILLFVRILLAVAGGYFAIDTFLMAGFNDGPKTSWMFKLMLGLIGGSTFGLSICSLMGSPSLMLLFATSSIVFLAILRLWLWVKGMHMSEFASGKTVRML